MATRKERDSLGERELPEEAYYGVNALRAVENFPVSGLKASPYLIKAYALVKQAAAEANSALGAVEKEKAEAIAKAAAEIVNGKFHDQFIVDVFQAGAGTSTNMNFNEVIANRALELLAKKKGDYAFISPNDHVNRGQSTNDTFPTILNLSILLAFKDLEGEALLLRLGEAGICVSTGSACTTGQKEASHVLRAMGVPSTHAMGAVRFSLSRATTSGEIDRVLQVLPEAVASLRRPAAARPARD